MLHDGSSILWFGKHVGYNLSEVARRDPQYIHWLAEAEFLDLDRSVVTQADNALMTGWVDDMIVVSDINKMSSILPFGRHKGFTVKEAIKKDPTYMIWAINFKTFLIAPDLVDKIKSKVRDIKLKEQRKKAKGKKKKTK